MKSQSFKQRRQHFPILKLRTIPKRAEHVYHHAFGYISHVSKRTATNALSFNLLITRYTVTVHVIFFAVLNATKSTKTKTQSYTFFFCLLSSVSISSLQTLISADTHAHIHESLVFLQLRVKAVKITLHCEN